MFPKVFKGVRILDFSRLLPGPFASDLLLKMGAEVQCILPPEGDPILGAYSPFIKLQQGKGFLSLDLKKTEDLKKVQAMLPDYDILLEGFRPATLERLGLGFQELQKIHRHILYVSLRGYPKSHEKYLQGAHDLNFLIDAGVYSLIFSDESQEIPLLQLADVLGGFYAAFQILASWMGRGLKPKQAPAAHLEISVLEALDLISDYLKDPGAEALIPVLTGSAARYHIYRTKDQQRIMVAAIEAKFFANLLKALDLDFASHEEGEFVKKALEEKFAQRTLAEWKQYFKGIDACLSFIPSRAEALLSSVKT